MLVLPTRETRRRRGHGHVGYAIMVHARSETHGRRSFSICTTRKMRHARKQGFSAVGKHIWIDWERQEPKRLCRSVRGRRKSGSDDALTAYQPVKNTTAGEGLVGCGSEIVLHRNCGSVWALHAARTPRANCTSSCLLLSS
jgi:hypothetical protein